MLLIYCPNCSLKQIYKSDNPLLTQLSQSTPTPFNLNNMEYNSPSDSCRVTVLGEENIRPFHVRIQSLYYF